MLFHPSLSDAPGVSQRRRRESEEQGDAGIQSLRDLLDILERWCVDPRSIRLRKSTDIPVVPAIFVWA